MSRRVPVFRNLFIVCLVVPMCASMISFSSSAYSAREMTEIRESTQTLNRLSVYVDVDSSKEHAIHKVLSIISQYNDEMQEDLKLAIANEIYRMSVKYENLDIDLICATITHESARTWKPTVVSPVGALGLMQIMPYTGYFLSTHEGIEWTNARQVLFDPVNNIRMGCRYLSRLIELYSVDGGLVNIVLLARY